MDALTAGVGMEEVGKEKEEDEDADISTTTDPSLTPTEVRGTGTFGSIIPAVTPSSADLPVEELTFDAVAIPVPDFTARE
jgi:hypothetical protein